jgi:hypothetical protein
MLYILLGAFTVAMGMAIYDMTKQLGRLTWGVAEFGIKWIIKKMRERRQ